MESYIHKYLSKFFVVSTSEESGKKIQILVVDGIYYKDDVTKEIAYGESLLKEISTIFAIPTVKAKEYITNWAKTLKRNIDLTWYWEQASQLKLFAFPAAVRIAARTIGMDLVSVQPMSAPSGKLYFLNEENKNEIKIMLNKDIIEEKERQSWVPDLVNIGMLPWQIENMERLIENQKNTRIGVSSRKKED